MKSEMGGLCETQAQKDKQAFLKQVDLAGSRSIPGLKQNVSKTPVFEIAKKARKTKE